MVQDLNCSLAATNAGSSWNAKKLSDVSLDPQKSSAGQWGYAIIPKPQEWKTPPECLPLSAFHFPGELELIQAIVIAALCQQFVV